MHAAQFLRSAAHAQRNFLAAQFLLFLANRGGPRGGPRAPNKRPRARGPKGPKGPSGPSGPIGDRLYATKIILNRINNTQRKCFRMKSVQAENHVRQIRKYSLSEFPGSCCKLCLYKWIQKTPTSLPRIRGPDGDHPHGGVGWGGGKPPPSLSYYGVLTRRTEGRRMI